jgi:sugar lactone lactonase YvrE
MKNLHRTIAAAALLTLAGCSSNHQTGGSYYANNPNPGSEGFVPLFTPLSTGTKAVPERVAAFDGFQAVGLAISTDGRLFVSSPRWHGNHGNSVVEIQTGKMTPPSSYPTEAWNSWTPGVRPERSWVCVQAMHTDDTGRLWVLDPGAPMFEGPIQNAAKLIRFDTADDKVSASYIFNRSIAPEGSYLNDVRIDTKNGFAYMSDSGLGAIVAVDLTTGAAGRFLEDHPSTKADLSETLIIGGEPWVNEYGDTPTVHSDGIALSPDGESIYYQALTGRTLYRIPTGPMKASLRPDGEWGGKWNGSTATDLATYVENLGQTFVSDAMIMDHNGVLYFTALERDAITARLPSGELVQVTADHRINWPDSLAIHGGRLYFTTARIHETGFGRPEGPFAEGPFGVFRVPLINPE